MDMVSCGLSGKLPAQVGGRSGGREPPPQYINPDGSTGQPMRRWNGWGDDSIRPALDADALAFLQQRVGRSRPFRDATLAEACRNIAPSRLPPHRLIDTAPETRLRCALGQSLPDWLKLRYGRVDVVPDGVAFPESGGEVRELLDYARGCAAAVIAYGGGTSVAGPLTVLAGEQPVLSINLSRLAP